MSNPCLDAVPKGGDWMQTHEDYVEKVKCSDCDVIFIGDSIIKFLERSCLWHDFRTACSCLNLGIPGDRVENVLWRIKNGELDVPNGVKAVVLLVGTNNIDCTEKNIFEGILEIIKEIRGQLGDIVIIIPSLLPKGQYPNPYRSKNYAVNKMLKEKFCDDEKSDDDQNIYYIEVGYRILEPDDTISETHLYDYLHLTDIGYIKTFTFILDKLQELNIAK